MLYGESFSSYMPVVEIGGNCDDKRRVFYCFIFDAGQRQLTILPMTHMHITT
jgi:hypothetical protein